MIRDDANQLAKRIVNVWRTSIPHGEWSNYLVGLDDPAIAARVIDECLERELRSFREFGAEYRARVAITLQTAPADESEGRLVRDLTREQRMAILAAAGAPRHLTTRQQGAHPL